jgi:cytochrome c oxidase subunit 2
MKCSGQTRSLGRKIAGIAVLVAGGLLAASLCFGAPTDPSQSTNIFQPLSTPAHSILQLSMLVLAITAAIFAVVFSLLAYSVAKFRKRANDDGREPAQVYGSNQIELAWTVIPILIVLVLFLATARVIRSIQDAPQPAGAIVVTAIGHQFWWEFRYPALGVVTANELHVPVSNPARFSLCFLPIPITVFGCRGWPERRT